MISEPADPPPVLRAEGLRKRYARDNAATRRRGLRSIWHEVRGGAAVDGTLLRSEFWALDDVSLELERGQALGVMGLNGSGKSTLLRVLAGLSKPDAGTVQASGRLVALLDPSGGLDPLLSGRENVMTSPVLWDLEAGDLADVAERIATFADIGDFLAAPVRTYSKGMRMRLAFATVANAQADVILIDEALAVGDIAFQRTCVEFLRRFVADGGALVIVSHSTWALETLCQRGLLLHRGTAVADGPIGEVTENFAELLINAEAEQVRSVALGAEATIALGDNHPGTALSGGAARDIDGAKVIWTEAGLSSARLLGPTNGRPVGFTHFSLSDPGGGQPRSGMTLCVRIAYRSEQAFEKVDWAIMLFSNDGQVAVGLALTLPEERVEISAGRGELQVEIPLLPLTPGSYTARTALIEAPTQVPIGLLGVDTPATRFQVGGEPITVEIHGAPHIRPMLRSPGAHWSVDAGSREVVPSPPSQSDSSTATLPIIRYGV